MKTIRQIIPATIPATRHTVSPDEISNNALKVLYRLKSAGYQAFLVGGGVRDLLLNNEPKDFDIATNARPEEVRALFRNCRLIGRRFRLAHILYGRDVIEVATFRGHHEVNVHDSVGAHSQEGRILRDNVYGSIEEDAARRDFTVNALYYNIEDGSIADYTNGMDDLQHKTLRMIGDVATRYREDPVRMLRAVRFAAKLGFTMEKQTGSLIFEMGHLLSGVPVARLFDESVKLLQGGYGLNCFELLREYQMFDLLFPLTEESIAEQPETLELIRKALTNTDERIASGKSVNPAFLLAVLLYKPMLEYKETFLARGMHEIEALLNAGREVITRQQAFTSIPRRYTLMMREIWHMLPQLQQPTRKRALRTLQNKRFRAGYDFLLLRQMNGEEHLQTVCQWWTEIQTKDPATQQQWCDNLAQGGKKRSKRSNRRRKKTANQQQIL
jgi:poly(A) polymerase